MLNPKKPCNPAYSALNKIISEQTPFGKIRTPFGKKRTPFEKILTPFEKILTPFERKLMPRRECGVHCRV